MSQSVDVHAYHKECVEIGETANFQHNEILTARANFLDKVKLTQERRCLTSLRSGYCLRMKTREVQAVSQLPFMKPDGCTVKERLIEVADARDLRSKVNDFLQSVYDNIALMPECLARIPSSKFDEQAPFLPPNVQAKDFIACSTLPALFGHCWTFDLKIAYINFIVKIAQSLPKSVFSNFRQHWLFNCFKNYIYASNIHTFLKLSMWDILLEVIRSKETNHNALIGRVSDIVQRMEANISTFPMDVRILLRKFACLTSGETVDVSMIEMLFMDGILAPAISMPKTYCVLPATFQLEEQRRSPLLVLASVFTLILHPEQAKARHTDIDLDRLSKIPFGSFLKKLANVDPATVDANGPTLVDVMKLVGQPCAIMLFTMSDVYLLANAMSDILSTAHEIKPKNFEKFEFFRYELWNVESLLSQRVEIRVNEVERAPPSTLASVASALFKFLTYAPYNERSPNTLTDFLRFYESQAHLRIDFKMYTYLNHLVMKLQELLPNEYPDVFGYLDDEIRRQKEFIDRNNFLLNAITRASIQLDHELEAITRKTELSYPIIYSCILHLWLKTDPTVQQQMRESSQAMLTSKAAFVEFFSGAVARMKQFVAPFAGYAIPGVTAHFHTWITQALTLEEFQSLHPEFARKDSMLTGATPDIFRQICIDPAPAKLKPLFVEKALFDFCRIELLNASLLKVPLEAITKISSAVNIVQKMFELACGGMPQADEMTPLFNFALLHSGMSDMFSLQRYLEHFLSDISIPDVKLMDERLSVALTHFNNHVSSMADLVESLSR